MVSIIDVFYIVYIDGFNRQLNRSRNNEVVTSDVSVINIGLQGRVTQRCYIINFRINLSGWFIYCAHFDVSGHLFE